MRKRNATILIIFFGFTALALIAWFYLKKNNDSVALKKPDFIMQAKTLLAEFEADENAANSKYLNKIIQITGTIESKSSDSTGFMIYLKEADAISGVICSFNTHGMNPDQIRKGKMVRIKGICGGYLMDVVLNKCVLEPDSTLHDNYQPQTSGFFNYFAFAKYTKDNPDYQINSISLKGTFTVFL